ncbi:MAG TPA: hypothetical protein VF658_15245 [Pyrinomonadaceae bacterium]|jgi:hypothetical protein
MRRNHSQPKAAANLCAGERELIRLCPKSPNILARRRDGNKSEGEEETMKEERGTMN